MVNKVFKKKNLRLREDIEQDNKPELAVSNPDTKNDGTQNLDKAISDVNMKNTSNANLRVQTSQFTNKNMSDEENDTETVLPNNSASINKIKTDINTGKPSGSYILKNGITRDGRLVEVATFSKRELTEFLKSI